MAAFQICRVPMHAVWQKTCGFLVECRCCEAICCCGVSPRVFGRHFVRRIPAKCPIQLPCSSCGVVYVKQCVNVPYYVASVRVTIMFVPISKSVFRDLKHPAANCTSSLGME
jgi:hypothetical protein